MSKKPIYKRPTVWLMIILALIILSIGIKISGKSLSITGLSTEYPLNSEVQFTAVASGIGGSVACTAYANIDIVSSSGQKTSKVLGEKQLTTTCVGSPCNSNSPFKIITDVAGTYTVKVTYSCVSGIDTKSFTVKSLLPSCSNIAGNCKYPSCFSGEKVLNGSCDSYSSGYVCCGQCNSHADYKCYGGEIWWYSSCGNRETIKEDCTSCVSGTKQCNVLECVGEGKSCGYNANSEPKCCSGLSCDNFQCVSGSNTCINDCVKDETSCMGSITTGSKYIATCGNYDSDSCYEYPSDIDKMTSCQYGCENNKCKSSGTVCVPNIQECIDMNTFRQCTSTGSGYNDQQNCESNEICKEGKCIANYETLCEDKVCDDKNENTLDSCVEGGCIYTKKNTSCTKDETTRCEIENKLIVIAECKNGILIPVTNSKCDGTIIPLPNHVLQTSCLAYQELKDGECKFSVSNIFSKAGYLGFKDNEPTLFWIIHVIVLGLAAAFIYSKRNKQQQGF